MKITTTVRLDAHLVRGCQRLQALTGAPVSESIRRAIVMYLEAQKIDVRRSAAQRFVVSHVKPAPKKTTKKTTKRSTR